MEKINGWFNRIVQRTKDLITNPRGTWTAIKDEEISWASLLRRDLLLLAAFPSIALILGWGNDDLNGYLGRAILLYVFYVAGIWGLSRLIVFLSPKFGATPDSDAAFKLIFYSFWPVLVTGILFLIRLFAVFTLIGYAYGLYLLWIGLPILVETPPEKSFTFRLAAFGAMLLASYLIIILTVSGVYPIIF